MNKIILKGKQIIDGEANFENVIREFSSFEEYRKFYEETRKNALSMYGNFTERRTGVFGFTFADDSNNYEMWYEVNENNQFTK